MYCRCLFFPKKSPLKKHFWTILAHIPVIFFGGLKVFGPEIPVGCRNALRKIPSQEEAERLAQLRAAKVAQANASKKAEEKAKEWSFKRAVVVQGLYCITASNSNSNNSTTVGSPFFFLNAVLYTIYFVYLVYYIIYVHLNITYYMYIDISLSLSLALYFFLIYVYRYILTFL